MARFALGAALVLLLASAATAQKLLEPSCQAMRYTQPLQSFTGEASGALTQREIFPLDNVGVSLDVDHVRVGNLQVTLAHDGTDIVLKEDGVGGLGNNLKNAAFWDNATEPFPQGANAGMSGFTGAWAPAEPLAALRNASAAGEWVLTVMDVGSNAERRPITLNSWTLYLCPSADQAAWDALEAQAGADEGMGMGAGMAGAPAAAPAAAALVTAQEGGEEAEGTDLSFGHPLLSGKKQILGGLIGTTGELTEAVIGGKANYIADSVNGTVGLVEDTIDAKKGVLGALSKAVDTVEDAYKAAFLSIPIVGTNLRIRDLVAQYEQKKEVLEAGSDAIVAALTQMPLVGPAAKVYQGVDAALEDPATYRFMLTSLALTRGLETSLKMHVLLNAKLLALAGKGDPIASKLLDVSKGLTDSYNAAVLDAVRAFAGAIPDLSKIPTVGQVISRVAAFKKTLLGLHKAKLASKVATKKAVLASVVKAATSHLTKTAGIKSAVAKAALGKVAAPLQKAQALAAPLTAAFSP